MLKIKSFELISHGIDHSDFFQGCGVSFTSWSHVVTGIGSSEKSAFKDALDQIDGDFSELTDAGENLSNDLIPENYNENCYYYFSIRYNLEKK